MSGINSTWDDLVKQSDGRYLTDRELQAFQQYLQKLPVRIKTYEIFRDKGDAMVKMALKKFAATHPDVMQKYGKRCLYDMTETVRIMAISILRDDLLYFKEVLVFWQVNILSAYQRQQACHKAYIDLQEVFTQYLPPAANQLVKSYLDIVIETLDRPVKLMATVQRPGG